MDYASLQSELRKDALATARLRVEALRGRLARPNAQRSEEAQRDVRYLERTAVVVAKRGQMEAFVHEVEQLSARFAKLPLARRSVGAVVDDILAGAGSGSVSTAPRTSTASSSSSPSSSLLRAGSTASCEELDTGSFRTTLAALGSFLFPELPSDAAEDEVRLLALEGRLVEELTRHARLTHVGDERTVFLRSWGGGGGGGSSGGGHDPEETGAKAGVVAMSFSSSHGAEVLPLTDSAEGRGSWEWLMPAMGLALGIGTAVLLHAPTGVGLVAATSGVTCSAKALEKWQHRVLSKMREQVPKALQPVPPEAARKLRDEACRRKQMLLQALAERRNWKPYWFPVRAWRLGLPILCQRSVTRPSGYAFATHFRTHLKARRVHALLERLSMMGSLDPGCKAVWARPVDAEGTSIRYLVFSKPLAMRDFFLLCHSGRAEADDGSVQPSASPPTAPVAAASPPPPFSCRDRTEEFAQARARRREGCAEAPWRERVAAALERGSTSEVLRLRDAARDGTSAGHRSGSASPTAAASCEACGALTAAPRHGGSCEVCLRWLCDGCCARREDVAPLLRNSGPGRVVFSCCEPCGRSIDALLWRRIQPPACLPASSAKLLSLHRELVSSMTNVTIALAQLEGLHRLLGGEDSHCPELRELWQELPLSRDAAEAARIRLEGLIREAVDVPCSGPSEQTLRENLCKFARGHAEKTKPLLSVALAAADECLRRQPDFDFSVGSWTPGRSVAERYAFSMTSCPSHLLSDAGEESVPVPSEGIKHGSMHLVGVVATDLAEGGSQVDVVADVDPDMKCAFLVDYDVRGHVLYTADRLRKEIEEEQKHLESSAMAEMSVVLRLLPSLP